MADSKSFLGTGWGFPATFIKDAFEPIRMAREEEDIAESLTILLSTRPGERVMRQDFGCALEDMLFEPINLNLNTYIKDIVTKAILYYEPRIDLLKIAIHTEDSIEGKITVELEYAVKATNARFNFVYDYYKREATILPQ